MIKQPVDSKAHSTSTFGAAETNGLVEPASEAGKQVSEAEYWATYYNHPDFSYEWNDGILEEKPVSNPLAYSTYQWFALILHLFLERYPVARAMALEMGFRLALPHKTTIRKPDLFVVHNNNPVPLRDHERTYKGVCDLCIESLSDSTKGEIKRDTEVKKVEYELIGVKEYYILDGNARHTAFYTLTPAGDYTTISAGRDGVIRSGVLPGFQFRILDLYQRPSLIELAEDPIYQDFILVEYQLQKQYTAEAQSEAAQAQAQAQTAQAQAQAQVEAAQAQAQAQVEAAQAQAQAAQAQVEAAQAQAQAVQAELVEAKSQATQAEIQAQRAHSRAERLAAQLRALGIPEE